MASSKRVNSISRAARILHCISEGTSRITKIASETGLSNSTVHRLLNTLQEEGFVVQDPLTRRYILGHLLITLTVNPLMTHSSLVSCATEEMVRLREISGETIGLVIRTGLQRLHLEELPSKKALKYSIGKGSVAPIHVAASSKILLADISFQDCEKILSLIEKRGLVHNPLYNRDNLIREICEAKKNGYAVSFGEYLQGASSIAVPIKGYIMPVAICIFGPEQRFNKDKMMEVLPSLREASGIISKKINENIP